MENHGLAQGISSGLQLESPLVALAFVESPPDGVAKFDSEVPSACSFWRKAEEEVFYADAEQHFNCPVGAMVMGFDLPEAVGEQLGGLVEMMGGCQYLAPEEAAKIPSIAKSKNSIVYGPLGSFPLEPDLILMWLTPRQAMFFSEAAGTCSWTESVPTSALGRPACAALPSALNQSRPTLSLGCMGMRTFTEVNQDRMLAVIPGSQGQEFLDRLGTSLSANEAMKEFYEGHKAQFVA